MASSFSVAFTEAVDADLREHLIREDLEEDLIFVLYTPSQGKQRNTALLHTLLPPQTGDRQRHGNVSFNPSYLERACREALKLGYGVAFLHSHPYPGWQGMSADDVAAETLMAPTVHGVTDLPLVGLTVGSDGTWSARVWERRNDGTYERRWCESVRVVGEQLHAHFNDDLVPRPAYRDLFKRTITVWGEENHQHLARLHIGVVGLGSVGSLVAESLARMGMTQITLIDHDRIEPHNLDRTLGATEDDVEVEKVVIARRQALASATAAQPSVHAVASNLASADGYLAALDCDVLFSCVDRPLARSILNHFAYAHLIPVIDGGIGVRFRDRAFSGVDWQAQTVGPGRICLECSGQFRMHDAQTEREGKLDDPSYFIGLPADHPLKNNENVFPFSMNLASLEVMQFVALATGAGGMRDFGVQRYRFYPGVVTTDTEGACHPDCPTSTLVARGDQLFSLMGPVVTSSELSDGTAITP